MILKIMKEPDSSFWTEFDLLSEKSFLNNVQFKSAWLLPYINHRLEGSLHIICVYHNDNLIGCLPMEKKNKRATRFWSYRELSILGTGPSDFFEILALENDRENILSIIFKHLKGSSDWDHLNLPLLPNKSPSIPILTNIFSNKSFKIYRKELTGYNFEKTENDWETYYEEVFKKKNKDLTKGERRLQKDNIDYTFKVYKKNVFKKFISTVNLYAERRESLDQYNYYEDKSYRAFLEGVCENYESFGGVEFTAMENDKGDNIAIQLDFINKGIRYHWNHAFNEKYKRYSPGKILLKEILKNSFNSDIKMCNHMRGLSRYKMKFTSYQEIMPFYRIERTKSIRIQSTRLISKILKYLK
jgi:hypothetical protein